MKSFPYSSGARTVSTDIILTSSEFAWCMASKTGIKQVLNVYFKYNGITLDFLKRSSYQFSLLYL
ncbi:MAG: hypothetical protein WB706_05830, partial [Nitrososphaeraceae archaeon]